MQNGHLIFGIVVDFFKKLKHILNSFHWQIFLRNHRIDNSVNDVHLGINFLNQTSKVLIFLDGRMDNFEVSVHIFLFLYSINALNDILVKLLFVKWINQHLWKCKDYLVHQLFTNCIFLIFDHIPKTHYSQPTCLIHVPCLIDRMLITNN